MTGCANCGHAWLDHVGGEHCTRCSRSDAALIAKLGEWIEGERAERPERRFRVLRAAWDAKTLDRLQAFLRDCEGPILNEGGGFGATVDDLGNGDGSP